MKIRNLAIVALALTIPLAATACGTSGGSDSKSDTNSSSSDKDTSSDSGNSDDSGDSGNSSGEADGNFADMSTEEISEQLQEFGGMEKEQADCIAEALDKNDLNYDDFGDASGPEALNDPEFKQYIEDAMTCFTGTTTP